MRIFVCEYGYMWRCGTLLNNIYYGHMRMNLLLICSYLVAVVVEGGVYTTLLAFVSVHSQW
jgi:hypothetical protein